MRTRLSSVLVAATLVLLFVPSGVQRAQGKTVGPPEVAWKDMTFKQKKAYMKAAVEPTMKPIFQAFDAKEFKKFDCVTCHGKDGVERKFKMPSNDIHPLPNTKEAFEAKLKVEPKWPKFTEFMAQKVEPAMGKLLDVPVFDPKKPVEGAFSCGACHKLEGATPAAKPAAKP
jgi:mono/diheme cytochrome c family protein